VLLLVAANAVAARTAPEPAGRTHGHPAAQPTAPGANATLAAIPDNTALDLGAYACDGSSGVPPPCEAITDYSGFTYDPAHHAMLMFGGGHATTFRDDVDVFRFDSLRWSSAYPSTTCSEMTADNVDLAAFRWRSTGNPVSRHTYDQLVVAESTGQLLLVVGGTGSGNCTPRMLTPSGNDAFFAAGTIPAFDLDRLTWAFGDAVPSWGYAAASEYDPPSGRVVVVSQYGLWTYDPVAGRTARHLEFSSGPMGYANNLVYFPPDGKMYYIARGSPTRVFAVTLDRASWAGSRIDEVRGATGDVPDSQESGWAYDAANRVIGGGVRGGAFWAYDPLANHWARETMAARSSAGHAVGTLAFHALAYDPVDGVYLFITDAASGRRTWAYRWRRAAPTAPALPSPSPTRPTATNTRRAPTPSPTAPPPPQSTVLIYLPSTSTGW
jgi:hypothetical protein